MRDVAKQALLDAHNLPGDVAAGLEATVRFRPTQFPTWSNATHICVVEVDADSWIPEVKRYVVSEDCGRMINPMVVEGQIAGGVVQGIGNVLYEEMAYDGAGNPLATTFLDYLVPTTTEVPTIECFHIETPSNALGGYKGRGLQPKDELPVHAAGGAKEGRTVPADLRPAVAKPASLRMLPGLYWHRITEAAGRDPASIDITFTTGQPGPGNDGYSAAAHLDGLEAMAALGVTWNSVGTPGDSLDHAIECLEQYGTEVISQS